MKNRILILAGPTAVGKTEISVKLAQRINGEIISCDSMQIYKKMDIGSAKVLKEEMNGVRHHLIDIIEPSEPFSVSDFKTRAVEAIDEIISRGKVPIIAGGTGLYINSLIFNYNFGETNKDELYRQSLNELAKERGNEYIHDMLKDIDPISYEKLYPNDLKRVIRALEVYEVSGKTIHECNAEIDIYDIPYDVSYYVLNMDREKLYNRINKRVDIMFNNGLLNEVENLKLLGYNKNMQSMKGIGYKEIIMYLDGEISIDEASYLIKKGSRNYAKRQLTWFRKDKRVKWIDKDEFKNDNDIVDFIFKDYSKMK